MNRNLNPQEFGEQLSMFDAGPRNFGPFQSEGGPLAPAPATYPDPHASDPNDPGQEEMPDFGPKEGGMWDRQSSTEVMRSKAFHPGSERKETIVPTWELKTSQSAYHRPSVESLKEQGGDWPNVQTVKTDTGHHLTDGNHRSLAAKETGRLFVWADEYDATQE